MSASSRVASAWAASPALLPAAAFSHARPAALIWRQRSVRASAAEKKSLRSVVVADGAVLAMVCLLPGSSELDEVPVPVDDDSELIAGRLGVLLVEDGGAGAEPDAL